MSIFYHLAEKIWEGLFALKEHTGKYPDLDSSKKNHDAYLRSNSETQKKLKELVTEIDHKKKLIDKELSNITQQGINIAVFKKNVEDLLARLSSIRQDYASLADGTNLWNYGKTVQEGLLNKINECSHLLTTCHNGLGVINRRHRLLKKQEKKVER